MRLSIDLESYIFQLVQAVKNFAQELTINDIMAALVDHDKQLQYLKDTKVLAVNFRNQKSGNTQYTRMFAGLTILDLSKKD